MAVAVKLPDHPTIGQYYYDGHANLMQVWTSSGWEVVADTTEKKAVEIFYELKVVGMDCKISPESNLFEMITNSIEWMMMTALGHDSSLLENFNERSFILGIKPALEKDLGVTIKNMKVNTWLDHLMYKHVIGVALNIDQNVIDRYDEINTERLIASTINDLMVTS